MSPVDTPYLAAGGTSENSDILPTGKPLCAEAETVGHVIARAQDVPSGAARISGKRAGFAQTLNSQCRLLPLCPRSMSRRDLAKARCYAMFPAIPRHCRQRHPAMAATTRPPPGLIPLSAKTDFVPDHLRASGVSCYKHCGSGRLARVSSRACSGTILVTPLFLLRTISTACYLR
jgi:hypothetical protein